MRRRVVIVLGVLLSLFFLILLGDAKAQTAPRLGFDSSGHFAIGGERIFLRGVYDSGTGAYVDPGQWESVVFTKGGNVRTTRGLADTAINMYLNYWQGQDTLAQLSAAFTTMAKYDVLWMQTANCFEARSYTAIPFSVDQAPAGQLAGALAQSSLMAGYYIMDECADYTYGGADLVPETQQHYATLKSYDPQAVIMAVPIALGYRDPKVWTQPLSGGPTADLFATDPYPLFNAEPATGYPHFTVADYIARLRDSVAADKPIASVLQFFKFTTNSRLPSYAEMRMHAYASIVEGAQGLFWWDIGVNGLRKSTNTDAQVTQWMSYLETLVNELAALEPALVATPAPEALVGNSSSTGDPIGWRKAVVQRDMTIVKPLSFSTYQWYQAELNALNAGNTALSPMLRQSAPQSGNIRTRTSIVDGVGYVIAYNYTNLPATVTLTWQRPVAQVNVIGEGRTLTPASASFSDSFGPYDVHVYQITPVAPLTASVTNPGDGASIVGTATLSAAASGGTPPYNFDIAVDGRSVYTGTNPTTSWTTTLADNGAHTITATVTDSTVPAMSATASVRVTVANLPPLTGSITSPADGTTVNGVTTINMADTGASGASTFALAIDGTTVSTQTVAGSAASYAWNTVAAGNGPHTLTLTVSDGAGRSVTTSASVSVSNISVAFAPPAGGATVTGAMTINASSSGGATGSRTFTLSFTGPTAVPPMTQTVSGATAAFSWDTTKVGNGAYALTLAVQDAGGTTATATDAVTVANATFAATITYPASGATVGGNQSVGLSTTAPWGKSKTFALTVDGATVATQTITGTTQWITWNTTGVVDGSHTLAVAVTYNGATARMAIPVTVKNAAPKPSPLAASFTAPAAGATIGTTASIGMASSGGASGARTFALAFSGPTAVAPMSVTTTATTATQSWDTTKVANGAYSLTVTVTDAAGATATATRAVTVSNSAPLTGAFTAPSAGATLSGPTNVAVSSTGGASGSRSFTVEFAGPTAVAPVTVSATGTTASFSWDTSKVTNGAYTLTLTVKDAAGATAKATQSVTVSNGSPVGFTATISYPANAATVGGNQTVGMSTTAKWGTSKTFTLSVDGRVLTQSTLTGTTSWYTWNTVGLANGTHTLTFAVTNGSGTATSSITVTVKN